MSNRVPPIMMTPNRDATSTSATAASSVWAPELDMNALERQVDHYADEAIKAAQKIQILPSSEANLLRSAAASNRIGGASISPRKSNKANKDSLPRDENEPTSWKTLPSLPPYILRLLFAAGQMYQWLTRTGSSSSSSSPNRRDPASQNVVGNFAHLVLPIHAELARMDPSSRLSFEKVVQYLTEFSEDFPQISEVELILHEVMSEISNATTPSKSQQRNQTPGRAATTSSINTSANARAVLPVTEGELMKMSPTQRAQFASDILACHRSPVVYAVRQWCFAIGRYLLLLDQWIQMKRRDIQVLSKERAARQGGSGRGGAASSQQQQQNANHDEIDVEDELAQTQKEMEETFKEKFLTRGGSMLLLKKEQQEQQDQKEQKDSADENRRQQQQQQTSSAEHTNTVSDAVHTTPAAQTRPNPSRQQEQQEQQKSSEKATNNTTAVVGTSISSQRHDENKNNNVSLLSEIANTQQQQLPPTANNISPSKPSLSSIRKTEEQEHRLVHSPMSVRNAHEISHTSAAPAPANGDGNNNEQTHHSVALSRLHYIQDAEERQRAMALVESYRQELALERAKRQEAESENRSLRLEASKFESKLTDVALEERKNAQQQIASMKKQLDSALADANSAATSRTVSEGSRAELENHLRDLSKNLENSRSETNEKIQQLLVTNQRLESTQVELKDARRKMEQIEQQKKELQREVENARILSQQQQRTPSHTPSRESSQQHNTHIRTIDGSMILAAASGHSAGHSSVLGVHRGFSPFQSALLELQNIENSARMEIEISELDYVVSNVNLMRGDLLSLLIGSERSNKYLKDKIDYTEKKIDEIRASANKNDLLESAQQDITRLRRENEELRQQQHDSIHELQSRLNQKSSADESRIRALEQELNSTQQKLATLEEGSSQLRFQAADTEHRLKLKFHEEQELRVKAEVALRNETEKSTKLTAELEALQKDKLALAELHREAVSEVTRVSSSADSSSKVLANRVQELEKLCDQQRQELDDTKKQNRAINDEMAAVRRHNASLDHQLANSSATGINQSSLALLNNSTANNNANGVLIDALKTKIETLESRDRENQSNHQNTVSQLEQRLTKLRSELLTATEASEHSMFDLRRNLQTAQLKAETAENQLKDAQRRVADTERELEYLREQNREISTKLQTNASARSDNEALKEQLRFVEDDLTRKRDEVDHLRKERQNLENKLREAQKNLETTKLNHEKQMHDEAQKFAENERNIKRRADDSIRETEKRAQEKYDQDLARVTSQLESIQRQDRDLHAEKISLSSELRRSNERIAQLEQQYQQAQTQIQDMRSMIKLLQTRAEVDERKQKSIERERNLEEKIKKQQEELDEQKKKLSLQPHPPSEGVASPINHSRNNNDNNNTQKIETLESISARVGISIEELMKANPLISSATAPLARGTRVMLPAVDKDGKESATTSTRDLGGQNNNKNINRSSLDTSALRSPSRDLLPGNSSFTSWNSLDDLISRLDINVDIELLKELNEKIVDGTDKPLPPGANVILPISAAHRVPSIEHVRSALELHADGAVRLRDGPEPSNADSALPLGSILNISRSLQHSDGATIRQLAQRLTMPVGALLEANPSIKDEFEVIPWYKTVFVPRREDPEDALSVSWRRTRKDKQRRERLMSQSTIGSSTNDSGALPSKSINNNSFTGEYDETDENVTSRPPWTLEETARRCGVSFDELMRVNSSAFPGTCRIPEDLLPHFVPFKFVLRPFRREVHPKRLQDIARLLENRVSVEDLLKANSGVSSGTAILRPHQSIKIPLSDSHYWRDKATGTPLTVSDVARMLKMSPVEFLRDNHRQYLNMSENVVNEFFITVRDVDPPNFGDFILQLGTIDPIERKKKENLQNDEDTGKSKFFDRLREAMDYGPRKNEFEDEEDLEEEAKIALMKKRRNSNDYWKGDKKNPADFDEDAHLSASQRKAMRQNAWATGWVSRVSVRDQKLADSERRLMELEEQERQSQSRVRHLPLLAAAGGASGASSARASARRSRSTTPTTTGRQHQQQHQQQNNGTDDVFVSDDEEDENNDEVDAAFNNTQFGKAKAKFSRPTSAAFLKLSQSSPPPLATLDNIPGDRPSSAAVLRQQIASARGSAMNNDKNKQDGDESGLQQPQQVAPRRPQLPEELRLYLKQEVTPTNKENTMQFFDFNIASVRKHLNDDTFRAIIELVAKKQSQSIVSVYFTGINTVAPEVVLKGVAILSSYCNNFKEFTTDQMQFPPATMAQLKLLMNRKEELRATKWIFESSVASQRSVMHLKNKKLTDASAVLLDALDEMTVKHGINIFDLRENFLTSGTGKEHLMAILKREWSPVTSILVDENPEMTEVARLQITELAEKKEKKQLQWMAYQRKQEMMSSAPTSPVRRAGTGRTDPLNQSPGRTARPMSASMFGNSVGPQTAIEGGGERVLSPTQKRFLNRFN